MESYIPLGCVCFFSDPGQHKLICNDTTTVPSQYSETTVFIDELHHIFDTGFEIQIYVRTVKCLLLAITLQSTIHVKPLKFCGAKIAVTDWVLIVSI